MSKAFKSYELLLKNVTSVIQGKDETIRLILAAWFSGGHVLIEDNPGTGKTVLAKSLARSIAAEFGRVQFTPDLLPSDITGTTIYDDGSKRFHFNKGPIFSTIMLADEINRATPRTQSALLEAMAEGQVTVDRSTHALPSDFFVIATQNPVEQHGTFPLPEAQLDRFAVRVGLGYPDREQEHQILLRRNGADPFENLGPVARREEILDIRREISAIKLPDSTMKYLLDLVAATRSHPEITLPASPRASLTLMRLGQAYSFVHGDDFVRPGTIHKLAPAVLAHRIALTHESRFQGRTKVAVVDDLLGKLRVPTR